jgi:GGDEF domain-containing protein
MQQERVISEMYDLDQKPESFLTRAGIELSRAERYRIFITLTELDLGFTRDIFGEEGSRKIMQMVSGLVSQQIRSCDFSAMVGSHCLCLLFPETSRQGAEVAARRISEIIRKELTRHTDQTIDRIIPVELASYPDAAGARTIQEFLEEIQRRSQN